MHDRSRSTCKTSKRFALNILKRILKRKKGKKKKKRSVLRHRPRIHNDKSNVAARTSRNTRLLQCPIFNNRINRAKEKKKSTRISRGMDDSFPRETGIGEGRIWRIEFISSLDKTAARRGGEEYFAEIDYLRRGNRVLAMKYSHRGHGF